MNYIFVPMINYRNRYLTKGLVLMELYWVGKEFGATQTKTIAMMKNSGWWK